MTTPRDPGDGDVTTLAELGKELPSLDLDSITAERIARRVRPDVGRGPSPARFVEPAVVALITVTYLVWALVKVLEAFGQA